MEKLALGISLICLLYIFLFFVLYHWLSQKEDEIQSLGRWSGAKRMAKSILRRIFNIRLKSNS